MKILFFPPNFFFQKLCKKYFETKFAKLNVEQSNFLVTRLKIQMLPAIFCFKKGVVVDRLVNVIGYVSQTQTFAQLAKTLKPVLINDSYLGSESDRFLTSS